MKTVDNTPADGFPTMRPWEEIQQAHDILQAVITGECPFRLSPQQREQFIIAKGVLCWALNHSHSTAMTDVLKEIAVKSAAQGHVWVRHNN